MQSPAILQKSPLTASLRRPDKYEPFSSLTLRALQHALREAQVTLEQAALDDIIKAYDALNTFPDVAPALLKLANTTGMTPVVFSNGTQSMVASSIARSPDLSPHAALFRQLVVVDDVKRYKPAPEVYQLLAQKCGREPGDIWVVSSNPFDVVGASSFGMRTVWVDRGGGGWTDRLLEGEAGAPTAIVGRLEDVVDAVTTNVTSGKSTSSS